MSIRPGYHKGDQHSGGGGSTGGGGKNRRPADGWEKGDVARNVDTHHTDADVPVKPGRKLDDRGKSTRSRARGHQQHGAASGQGSARTPQQSARPAKEFRMLIRAPDGTIDPAMRTYLRETLRTRLDKFSSHLMHVTVRFRDINGPKGGVDTDCQIRATLTGKDLAIADSTAEDARTAFAAALQSVEHTIRQSVDRNKRTTHGIA